MWSAKISRDDKQGMIDEAIPTTLNQMESKTQNKEKGPTKECN